MEVYRPTPAVYEEWQSAFDWFNERLFQNEVPQCLITLHRHPRARGYFSPKRFMNRSGQLIDEIAMNPECFAMQSPMSVLSTLCHEMAHSYTSAKGEEKRRTYHCTFWADKMSEIGLEPSSTGQPGGKRTGQQMSHCIVEGGPFDIACRELLATGDFVSWFDTYTQTESTGGHVFVAPAEPDKTSGEGNEEEGKTPPVAKGTPKPVQAVVPKAVAPAPAALGGNIIDKLMKPSQRKDKNSDGSNRLKFSCPSCKDNAWGKPTLMLICGRCQKPMAPTSQIPQTDSSENQESHAGA